MDKQRQDEFWEDRLKQTIREAESNPDAQAWDTPSDAVWAKVAETLEKKRRRIIPLYLVWGSLAAALLLTLGGIWLNTEGSVPDDALTAEKPALNTNVNASPNTNGAMDTEPCAPIEHLTEMPLQIPNRNAPLRHDPIEVVEPQINNTSGNTKNIQTTTPPFAPHEVPENSPVQSNQTTNIAAALLIAPFEKLATLSTELLERKAEETGFDPMPQKKQPGKIQWWAGVHGGPVYAANSVRTRQPGSLFFLNQEVTQWSSERGIDVKMVLPSGWYAGAGVGHYSIRQNATQVFRLRFARARERQLPSGEWESTYALSVPSSFGDTEAELDLRRDDSTPLQEGQLLVVETRSTQALQYLTYNIGTGFLKASGRWQFGGGAGIAFNVLQERKFTLTARARQAGIRLPVARTRSVFSDASGHSTDFQLNASIGYRVNSRWMLGVEPTLRHSLSPVVQHSNFSTAATAASLQLSVHYLL